MSESDFGYTPNLAVFCDFENVALGVRDARYEAFDIGMVLERILDKGKVVVKKAYADWDRYKAAKRPMHEAAFELIEIPHVSYSGKNSADIRMVVDALDLCYTKTHIDGFVIVSGDSDFSPLVSKLRENNKLVIGVGVKNSSSDLLIDNCDEFIYYDDIVRARRAARKDQEKVGGRGRTPARDDKAETKKLPAAAASAPAAAVGAIASAATAASPSPAALAAKKPSEGEEKKLGDKAEALELVLDTVESLFKDRDGNLHGSMVKQVLKRKKPNFDETYYGYRTFNQLLEDAHERKKLEIQKDEKGGGYVIAGFGPEA